jgi:hypothetical protein
VVVFPTNVCFQWGVHEIVYRKHYYAIDSLPIPPNDPVWCYGYHNNIWNTSLASDDIPMQTSLKILASGSPRSLSRRRYINHCLLCSRWPWSGQRHLSQHSTCPLGVELAARYTDKGGCFGDPESWRSVSGPEYDEKHKTKLKSGDLFFQCVSMFTCSSPLHLHVQGRGHAV